MAFDDVPNPAQLAPAVAALFPAGVAATELEAQADPRLLFSAEAALCSSFAPKRLAEFTAGRLCARRALYEFGITNFPIGINPDRSPSWPPAVVGSISHSGGYACAVVASKERFGSVGVDVEMLGGVTNELDALLFTAAESAYLASLIPAERARAATILFSAKEAFYKCQYPVTGQWLNFVDASLELITGDMQSGDFVVYTDPCKPPFEQSVRLPLRGVFSCRGTFVTTGLTLHRRNEERIETNA